MTRYFYFHSFLAFLHMGHYADYVWPAYGVALIILLLNLLIPIMSLRLLKNKMAQLTAE